MKNIVMANIGESFLIMRFSEEADKPFEYVVCTAYNADSDDWCWGHYFNDVVEAVDYFKEKNKGVIKNGK